MKPRPDGALSPVLDCRSSCSTSYWPSASSVTRNRAPHTVRDKDLWAWRQPTWGVFNVRHFWLWLWRIFWSLEWIVWISEICERFLGGLGGRLSNVFTANNQSLYRRREEDRLTYYMIDINWVRPIAWRAKYWPCTMRKYAVNRWKSFSGLPTIEKLVFDQIFFPSWI